MMTFDLSIYPAHVIQEAIRDFHEIAVIEADIQDSICKCKVSTSLYDTELTEKEFGNYVLDKTVAKG